MNQPRIVAGTRNQAKIAELAAALGDAVQIVAPPLGIAPSEEESGQDVTAVAAAKALAWSRALAERDPDALVAASDGGLLIPALGERWNPLHTRRFAGDYADDRARADALLALAADLEGSGWVAGKRPRGPSPRSPPPRQRGRAGRS